MRNAKMTHAKRAYQKGLRRKHRKANALHKEADRLRCANYQRTIDNIKRIKKRKGYGRAHKVKGEVMPTLLCANNHTPKSWKHFGSCNGKCLRGEAMKTAIIWELT